MEKEGEDNTNSVDFKAMLYHLYHLNKITVKDFLKFPIIQCIQKVWKNCLKEIWFSMILSYTFRNKLFDNVVRFLTFEIKDVL